MVHRCKLRRLEDYTISNSSWWHWIRNYTTMSLFCVLAILLMTGGILFSTKIKPKGEFYFHAILWNELNGQVDSALRSSTIPCCFELLQEGSHYFENIFSYWMYFLHNKVLRYEIEWRKCLLAMNNVTFNKLMNDIKCEV